MHNYRMHGYETSWIPSPGIPDKVRRLQPLYKE